MSPHSNFRASRNLFRGVFFLLLTTLFFSCESEEQTPDWPEPVVPEQLPTTKQDLKKPLKDAPSTRFVVYNLRNYLSMARGSDRKHMQPKPDHEITALINNIQKCSPDILGVCEIGTAADLSDLQKRLKTVGMHFPHSYLNGGADAYRRLAVLSKFPITRHEGAALTYVSEGKQHKILRGILDCSVNLPTGETRFIGVHLKSKRPSKYWDQERVRRNEAELVRRHVSALLNSAPQTNLVVYGDFNDTKQSSAIRAIAGKQNTPNFLRSIDLKAENGSRWTHYWEYQDIYSRLDYVFASAPMLQRIDVSNSYILDLPINDPASDHRPLVITIR